MKHTLTAWLTMCKSDFSRSMRAITADLLEMAANKAVSLH